VYSILFVDYRDHSAGNAEWRRRFTGIKIFGGALDAVPASTEYVCSILWSCIIGIVFSRDESKVNFIFSQRQTKDDIV